MVVSSRIFEARLCMFPNDREIFVDHLGAHLVQVELWQHY
jgi:hypothetical protein